MDIPRFRARLEQAFAAVPYPGDDNLTGCDCHECHDLDAYFRGKPWHGHAVRDLRWHQDAIHRFAVGALHYYLPAFVLAQLEDPVTADIISDSLISAFVPNPGTKAEALAGSLTPEQRVLMIEFFEYCVKVDGGDFDDYAARAITTLHAAGAA